MTTKYSRDTGKAFSIVQGAIVIAAIVLAGFGLIVLMRGARWTLAAVPARGAQYELVATWNGDGFPSGKFERPMDIAVAPGGDIYLTSGMTRVLRLSATGEFKGEWGKAGKGPGEFSNAFAVAVAPDGSVLVSDYDLDRIQKFTVEGKFLMEFGNSGARPGQLNSPAGIAVDSAGFIYLADFYNHRIQKFAPDGAFVQTIGHSGRVGAGALHYPTGVSLTSHGELFVADAYNYQLQGFDTNGRFVRRAGHHLLWLWPRPAADSKGFNVPTGVAIAPNGIIHVADSANHRVVMLSARGEYLTSWSVPDANSNVYSPEKIAVSADGARAYATDFAANRVLVLKVTYPESAPDGTSDK